MGAVSIDQRAPLGHLVAGAKLGRYEILAKLATGGMAVVYAARVQGVAGFERLVAIKVLHANLAHEREFIHMFLDEARLAASIRHPNVVPTIELSDSDEAGYFLVMEYIEGDHLGALLSSVHKAGEKLPLPIALRIIADALSGLGAAHDLCDETGKSLQLVHRDVSPHNIMVGRDGVVRLTDFGVAKAEDRLTHTRDGQVKGKLAYMAPEQAANGRTDSRSDLFSMGVILWECTTGQRLFRAESTAATLHKLMNDEIPLPSSLDPQLAPLDALLGKALARDVSQRFQTAEDFAQAIEEVAPALGGLSSLRGVARCVKLHTAAKLKRDKKLIDDALRALRPADAPELALEELEIETTSPSVTDASVSGASLSASKVSGVFSHETLPGARKPSVNRRTGDSQISASALRPAPPPPPSAAQPATNLRRSGEVAVNVVAPPVARQRPRPARRSANDGSRLLLWMASVFLLGGIALWALRPEREHVSAHTITTPADEEPLAEEPLAAQPSVLAAPAVAVDPNGVEQGAAVQRAKSVEKRNSLPESSQAGPSVDAPVERAVRGNVQRDDPSQSGHRPRREHVTDVPARKPVRDRPASDVIPNPYHN